MNKLRLGIILGLAIMLFLPCNAVFADDGDGITVDINIEGDEPVVNVDAGGNNPTIYINGQDIQQPTAYLIENDYDDTSIVNGLSNLKSMLENTEANMITTSEGLIGVIQVLDEHTTNLRDMLDYISRTSQDSVNRDNELVEMGKNQDSRIMDMAEVLTASTFSIEENADKIKELESMIVKLDSEYHNKLMWICLGFGISTFALLVAVCYLKIRKNK